MPSNTPHSFHIPVMGLAFTVDTPIKVARFGISSVISIMQDNLIEKMRSYYYPLINEVYTPISTKEVEFRPRRIADYLNLVDRIVKQQVAKLKTLDFNPGSEINKYFEMLPDKSELKRRYNRLSELSDPNEINQLEDWLRTQIQPGCIDVNIMTKLDKPNKDKNGEEIKDGSDAVVAVRGFATSSLKNSSLVLSAGMNPRLFRYLESLDVFDADSNGVFDKKVVIKVSDYRSAFIQGKMLAKKGVWVSEFRIESGLNCGGHAFATEGYLMGPILEEFKNNKEELVNSLFEIYNQALVEKGKPGFEKAHEILITVQGGVGAIEESNFLKDYYGIDSIGWGTPFLLVPEATTVDKETLQLLSEAKAQDVILSKNSPLGIGFYYLNGTSADIEKMERIEKGKPGSPCPEKFLVSNTEFTKEPICTASHSYQKKKIAQLKSLDLSEEDYQRQLQDVLKKECLCIGLANAAVKEYEVTPFKNLEAVNVCPGPSIAYYSEIVSLKKMIDHIYGRLNLIKNDSRPHMVVKELRLYIDYWSGLLKEGSETMTKKQQRRVQKFYNNLVEGISYYRNLAIKVGEDFSSLGDKINSDLEEAETKLKVMHENFFNNVVNAV